MENRAKKKLNSVHYCKIQFHGAINTICNAIYPINTTNLRIPES